MSNSIRNSALNSHSGAIWMGGFYFCSDTVCWQNMYVQNSDQTEVKAEYWELCRLRQNEHTSTAEAGATGRARLTIEAVLIGFPLTRWHESFLECFSS